MAVKGGYDEDYDMEDAVKPTKVARPNDVANPNDIITIERREYIATVRPGNGEHTMLATAYMVMADYLGDHLSSREDAIKLEFRYGEHTFIAAAEPTE